MTNAIATTAVAKTVIRVRTEPRRRRRRTSAVRRDEAVAAAANGLDRGSSERCVDLAAEVPDVDLDDVGREAVHAVPDVEQQLFAGDHPALAMGEVGEQGEL